MGVGDCIGGNCSASFGPAACNDNGQCICAPGFCSVPPWSAEKYCLERVPDSTCHLSQFCYKAGLKETVCVRGLCMCKQNYRYNPASKLCELVDEANMEALVGFELIPEHERVVRLNVFAFYAWVASCVVAIMVCTAFVIRKFRVQKNGDVYQQLLAHE